MKHSLVPKCLPDNVIQAGNLGTRDSFLFDAVRSESHENRYQNVDSNRNCCCGNDL